MSEWQVPHQRDLEVGLRFMRVINHSYQVLNLILTKTVVFELLSMFVVDKCSQIARIYAEVNW